MPSPLLKQYLSIKEMYKDAIVLFRCGDFYEVFGQDAQVVSNVLGTTLTQSAQNDSETKFLTGFPFSLLDSYLPALVNAGHRVAVCEQLQDPKQCSFPRRSVVDVIEG